MNTLASFDLEAAINEETSFKEPPSFTAEDMPTDAFPDPSSSPQAPPKTEPNMPFNMQAKLMIGMLERGQMLALPRLYYRKMFTPEQAARAEAIEGKDPDTLTEEEQALVKKIELYRERVDAIRFSPEEVEFLELPLTQLLEKKGVDMSPGLALVMALLIVMLSRILPLF